MVDAVWVAYAVAKYKQVPLIYSSQLPKLSSLSSAHGYGHVDPQVPVVREELGDARVEDEAV